jgi:hypothetical protein
MQLYLCFPFLLKYTYNVQYRLENSEWKLHYRIIYMYWFFNEGITNSTPKKLQEESK